LRLRTGCDAANGRQIGEERLNLWPSHLLRVAFAVMKDEPPDLVDVGLLRAVRVVLGSKGESQSVEKSGRFSTRAIDCCGLRSVVGCGYALAPRVMWKAYGTNVYITISRASTCLLKNFFKMQGVLKKFLSNNKFGGVQ